MDTNQLAQLKDIHLPQPVPILPLASGWYMLAILLLVVLCLLGFGLFRYRQHKYKINNIYQLLSDIEHKEIANMKLIPEVSILLKRVARMKFPQEKPHILFGDAWLMFLDKTGKTDQFTKGVGRYLANVYQQQHVTNVDEFFALIRQWLKVVL